MEIKSKIKNHDGSEYGVIYNDADSFDHLPFEKVTQTYGVCFVDNKMVIVHIPKPNNDHWGLVGGTIEKGETFEQTLKREIQEESNMKVNYFAPIGYQEIQLPDKTIYQLRYLCIVEPYSNFVSDPAGSVKEIKLIDPKDYKQYFDWGEVGERIIARAVELKNGLTN